MTKDQRIVVANLGQWISLALLIVATIYLLLKREDFSEFLITISAVLFAIVTKIKYYAGRKKSRKRISISALRWRNGRLIDGTSN